MPTQERSSIQILPEHIIDQIKAGEVIERPSTLLKELLENSIDAGASKVSIEIINNGMDLIVVKDNGKGMNASDLELAFLRHATSKIERFEDIYNLHSYGFRGEALASMASVSKITCISNQKNSPLCTIKINGAEVESLDKDQKKNPVSKTEIFIKDLFYNTPARLKFVKSKTAEKNQLQKIINAFLLTHPQIEFVVKWDDKAKRIFKACEHLQRIVDVTQKNFQKLNYQELSASYDDINVKLFLSMESSRGAAGKYQYIFINNRVVQNIQIHKIITNCAGPLWGEGMSGHYTLFIDLPSDQIDVNVHPNKTVIKFFESHKVFSLISSTIKNHYKKSYTSSKENEAPLLSDNFQTEMKDKALNYTQSSLDDKKDLTSYFDRLDNKSEFQINSFTEPEEIQTLIDYPLVLMTKMNEEYYLLDKAAYTQNYIKDRLSKKSSSIPLLISHPIKVSKPSAKLIQELNNYGFELDQIEKGYLILRSIPEALKDIKYGEYLELLLNSKAKNKDDMIKLVQGFESLMTSNQIIKKLKNDSLAELLKLNIIKKITQEDLLNVIS